MNKFIIQGGIPLAGTIKLAGAKNVALKACIASLLTDDPIILHNIPLIQDVHFMLDMLEGLGVQYLFTDNTVNLHYKNAKTTTVPLEVGARLRTSSLVLGPLLARHGEAKIPNPGGCRIGARPIDRHIEGLTKMGAKISYNSNDGYYYATAPALHGTHFEFPKNTHTGTETLMLAAVLAEGQTVLSNAASEVEVDDLMTFLNSMGARIRRPDNRTIVIDGVRVLHGSEFAIMSDRNEEVTLAIGAALTEGSIVIENSQRKNLNSFIQQFISSGGGVDTVDNNSTKYYRSGDLKPSDIVTKPHPGFMTDWQGPWALLMTQAHGISTVHETVFENRFSYVSELRKMGSDIEFFDPVVDNPENYYNFNWNDRNPRDHQGIRISGPKNLHNAVLEVSDLRAGATLVLAALLAKGTSYIYGIEQIDRGYENIDKRLTTLGAVISRVQEEVL